MFFLTTVGQTGRLFTEVQSKLLREPHPITYCNGVENLITGRTDAVKIKKKLKNTEHEEGIHMMARDLFPSQSI